MKYIITSKNKFKGDSISDTSNPLAVTEIATEMVITRLYAIDLLQRGMISKEDTIVCVPERECLYENIFDNVITYKELLLKTLRRPEHTPPLHVIDLLDPETFSSLAEGPVKDRLIPYLPFYRNWERDKELLRDISHHLLWRTDNAKYICLAIRKRKAWQEKNMTDSFWMEVLERLSDKGVAVYVFGKETERFCEAQKIHHVPTFQLWCEVLKNASAVASTMSGAVYPAMLVSKKDTPITIIDNLNLMDTYGHDPSFYNDCVNFSGVKFNFINHIPSPKEFVKIITQSPPNP